MSIMIDNVPLFQKTLLEWYWQHKRDLPWRQEPTPYHVLLSETMLQQTQVVTVIPYYYRFLSRFPALQDLAAADEQEVLTYWSGLGYYRRARQLLKTAQVIQRHGQGTFPTTAAQLADLPGIGPYTSRAIASIAFNQAVAVVDGNVKRVLSRLCLYEGAASATFQAMADALLAINHPGDFNQAMMELGATVCTPKQPKCQRCPVQQHCLAFANNRQEQLPLLNKSTSANVYKGVGCLMINHRNELLLINTPPPPLGKSGFWEIPVFWETSLPLAAGLLQQNFGIKGQLQRELRTVHHAITNNRLKIALGLFNLESFPAAATRWLPIHDPPNLPVSGLTKKAVRLLKTI